MNGARVVEGACDDAAAPDTAPPPIWRNYVCDVCALRILR